MSIFDNGLNLGNYSKSIKEYIDKKEIVLDLDHNYESVEVTVKPMLELALNLSNAGYLRAEDKLDQELNRKIQLDEFNVVEKLNKASDLILDNKPDVLKLVNKVIGKAVVKETLDYEKVNLLQYLECINYFIDYTKHWLAYYQYEMLKASGNKNINPEVLRLPMWKAETQIVSDINRVNAFIAAVNVLIKPVSEIEKKISNLEGHLVNLAEWDNSFNVSTDKLNPLKINHFGVTLNPFYHLGLVYNSWMNNKNLKNKEELQQLQMTVLFLQEVNSDNPDPAVKERYEKQIKYHSNRINDLAANIRKYEGDD